MRPRLSLALFVFAVLGAVSLLGLAPFLWSVLTSFKPLSEVDNPNPWPSVWRAHNYREVLDTIPYARYYANSLFLAAWTTLLQCVTCSMAAFAFARMEWPGRDKMFQLYLGTLMIPGVVTLIPSYQLMIHLHLLDTYAGLIVPGAFSAFGTFMLRQFMFSIPSALDEAATIDGASQWVLFWDVILPLARPGLITLAIFTFLGNYGSFFWPLLIVKSEHMRTLPVGLMYFNDKNGPQTNLIMAATMMSILPPLLIYIVGQKYLVRGIQIGAVKG
ncbi:carbohydrate ABC transporter permease [soil metagenome]